MPNWCMNNMIVTGPQEDVARFWDGLGDDKNNVLSTYAPLQTENGEWDYFAAVANWGTKWDFDISENSQETINGTTYLYASFDTAWAPATDGIAKIAAKFPSLKFAVAYFEPGMGFYGYDIFFDGELQNEFADNIPDFPLDETADDCYDRQWNAMADWWNTYSDGVVNTFGPKVTG